MLLCVVNTNVLLYVSIVKYALSSPKQQYVLIFPDNKYLWAIHTSFIIHTNWNRREFIIQSGRFYKPVNNELPSIPKDMDYNGVRIVSK